MIALTLIASLDGVTDLRPDDSPDSPFLYTFKVLCTSCRETHAKWVKVNRFESFDMASSRGEAHFTWRCKNCKRERSASIRSAPRPYPGMDPPEALTVLEIECRGLEFSEFRPQGNWLATGTGSNTAFGEIDLAEGEWFDYDEQAGKEVSVTDVKWELRKA